MSEVEKINVQKIVEEIRKEIEEKGYTEDMLSFHEIPIENELLTDEFQMSEWKNNLKMANARCQINYYREIPQTGIKKFIKRVIRKLAGFLIIPIIEEQNDFNAYVVRCLNQVDKLIDELDAK